MKLKYLYLFFTVLVIVILVLAFYVTADRQDKVIGSAKELKISASDVGPGWEEHFYYMSDPAAEIGEFSKVFREREEVLEFSDELSRSGVKDGYFLFLEKESPKAIVEIDVFVFNSTNGSKGIYHFMRNEIAGEFSHFTKNNASTSGIGDDAAFYSSGSTHIWVVRASNALIRVITWDGQDTGREVVESIVEKAKR